VITLATFAAQLAAHIVHGQGWTLQEARGRSSPRQGARKEYREHGAPLGDTDEGFVPWLQPRYQPPTA